MTNSIQHKDFWSFISLLSVHDLLTHVTLIGSWTEYIYAQARIMPGFSANLRTLDIDFVIRNKNKPSIKLNLSKIAQNAGYTIDSDTLTGCTKFYSPGGMEIEFLIGQLGLGNSDILETNMGVQAQALRHLNMLTKFSMTVRIFEIDITVPMPEAYALHKIIIHEQRGKKQNKDKEALNHLLPFLNMETVKIIFTDLTKKEKNMILKLTDEFPQMESLRRYELTNH